MAMFDFLRPTNTHADYLKPFYESLRQGKLTTTRCPKCQEALWPPRVFCPNCLHDPLEWEELPLEGTLYSWSEFHDKRFSVIFKVPYVLGAVDLANGLGRLLTRVRAPAGQLRVGMPLRLVVMKYKAGNQEWGVVEAEPK